MRKEKTPEKLATPSDLNEKGRPEPPSYQCPKSEIEDSFKDPKPRPGIQRVFNIVFVNDGFSPLLEAYL